VVEFVNNTELFELHKQLTFGYQEYLDWLDEVHPNQFYGVSTYHINVANIDAAGIVSSVKYDSSSLIEHANIVSQIACGLTQDKFLVEHEYKQLKWFPLDVVSDYSKSKIQFLTKNSGLKNIDDMDFPFLLDNSLLNPFLKTFIDYPYLLSYKDIDVLAIRSNFILKIGHHLNLDFVTADKDLAESFYVASVTSGLFAKFYQ
jgi:hypothetical protein